MPGEHGRRRRHFEGSQHNTLDQPWFGKIAWLSSLYLAAARACEEMAREMGDEPFARRMQDDCQRGSKNIDRELFNGEYYIQIPDRAHVKSVGSHNGCEVDQVFGQSWAYQVGIGPHPRRGAREEGAGFALEIQLHARRRPLPQSEQARPLVRDGGRGGPDHVYLAARRAARLQQGCDFYFNECMNGFEHQVAGHMIWEGMVQEGLAVERMLHDRYHASRRNPWNEVECGDHYARSMASYGVFLAACGYEYHGPKGRLAFAPRLTPENFRAPFTTAEGWGTFSQQRDETAQRETLALKWGKLRLRSLAFELPGNVPPKSVRVTLNDVEVRSQAPYGRQSGDHRVGIRNDPASGRRTQNRHRPCVRSSLFNASKREAIRESPLPTDHRSRHGSRGRTRQWASDTCG